MPSYHDIFDAPWVYLMVILTMVAIIAQCLIFMGKAWRHALAIGLDQNKSNWA